MSVCPHCGRERESKNPHVCYAMGIWDFVFREQIKNLANPTVAARTADAAMAEWRSRFGGARPDEG